MTENVQTHFCPVGDRRRPVAILFDLDGTLVDHARAVDAALGEIHAAYAEQIGRPEKDFRIAWKTTTSKPTALAPKGEAGRKALGRMRLRRCAIGERIDDTLADRIFAEYEEAYESHWTLFDDAMACLERLRGRPMAIVTNGPPKAQRRKLSRLGLREHFREILVSEEQGTAKPSPDIFLEASRRLWSLPSECVVVGDSWEHDIEGALRAGMQPVWLDRKNESRPRRAPIAHGLDELPARIDGWQIAKPLELPELDFAA